MNNKKLLILTVIGLFLRILNPAFGSPVLYVIGDEVSNYMSALTMISNRTLISLTSQYTPLGSYIQIPFFYLTYVYMKFSNLISSVGDFEFYLLTHEGFMLFIPRLLSGIFGTLTIPVIYFLTKELFPKEKGIRYWSVLLFTFSLNHIQLSHLAKPWTASLLFYSLSMLFAVKSVTSRKQTVRFILLSAFAIILSFGFLQIAFYAFCLFLLIRLFKVRLKSLLNYENIVTICATFIVCLACIIFVLLTKFKPHIEFLFQIEITQNKNILLIVLDLIKGNKLLFFIRQLLSTETILILFSVPAFFLRKMWKKHLLPLTIYQLVYFFIVIILFWEASRYLLPLILTLPIYAAVTIDLLERKIKYTNYIYSFRLVIICSILFLPLLWNFRFLQKPTFIMARNWISNNIEPDLLIASTSTRFNSFVPSHEAIAKIQAQNPTSYKKLSFYLKPNFYPDNVRNILYLDQLVGSNRQNIDRYVKDSYINFVVNYYWNPKDSLVIQNPHLYETYKVFSPFKNNEVNGAISNLYSTMTNPSAYSLLLKIERPGPYAEIVKVL